MFGTLDTPTQAFEKATLKELCNKITDGKHGGCKSEVEQSDILLEHEKFMMMMYIMNQHQK